MKKKLQWAGILTAAALLAGTAAIVPAQAADTVLHAATFENGTDGWASFGGTTVTTTSSEHHDGASCMYVSGRSDSWQGASCSMDTIMTPGRSYGIEAYVMPQAASDTISLTLKYTDASGDHYSGIDSADGAYGTWSRLSATCTIPSDATSFLIYFQTGSGTNDFMVDDVTITGEASWSTEALSREPLKDIYANYFRIGCAATPDELNTTISQDIVKRHFNSLTLGNELKPDYVLNQAGSQANGDNVTPAVSLDRARSVLSFCEENNIPVRGHVLLWYSQTPSWFFKEGFSDNGAYVSKDVMNRRLENYIKAVMAQIALEFPKLNVYCWDVVNECYLNDGSLRAAGTNPSNEESQWTLIYGDNSYIEQAFTYARKYAPAGTKLFYNDFNEYISGKRDAIYSMAKDLADKGLIDGIGMQSHLDVGYPDASLYRQAIEKYNQLGLEIQITELDITQYDAGGDLSKQTQAYKDIMQVIVDEKKAGANITAVVFWGITDGTSWRKDGAPLLLAADYSCKGSYDAVESILPKSEWGKATEEPVTDEPTTEAPTPEPTTEEPTAAPPDGLFHARKGDIYADGYVNLLDVVQLQKYLIGVSGELITVGEGMGYPREMVVGDPWDLNDDGKADIVDLILLKQAVLTDWVTID